MVSSPAALAACLTDVTDPAEIGKVILMFDSSTKFPWLPPILSENFPPEITGHDPVERRYIDLDDKTKGFIQDSNGIDSYFVVNPAIIKI